MNFSEFFRQPRARQTLIDAVNVGALLALTTSLAHWSWLIIPSPQFPVSPTPASHNPTLERTLNIQPLLMAHLFGQADAIPVATNSTAIQPSSLNLVLTGIIGVKDAGLAIISVNDQPQESFVVGQTITGNAILQAVYLDRVTIIRDGVVESVHLDTAAAGTSSPSIPVPRGAMGQPSIPDLILNHQFVNRDTFLDKTRTTEAIKKTAFAPVSGGLLVLHGQKGNIFENFGVQKADVIRSINGQNITTFDDVMRAYQSLIASQGGTDVQIEIIRHGKPQFLRYRME